MIVFSSCIVEKQLRKKIIDIIALIAGFLVHSSKKLFVFSYYRQYSITHVRLDLKNIYFCYKCISVIIVYNLPYSYM